MKKFILTQIIITFLMSYNYSFGQTVEYSWILYPNIVDLNSTPPVVAVLPNVTPPYDEYTDSNGAFDDNGNLLFYLIDSDIYDNTSSYIGYLQGATSGYTLPLRETNIVPVPNNNNKFYIIYSLGNILYGQDLLFATIDCSGGTCSIVNNGNLLNHYEYGNNNGVAISKLLDNDTRRMYLASNDYIKRFEITSSGITFVENILSYPNTYGLYSYDFDAFQLELSNDCSKLAWEVYLI